MTGSISEGRASVTWNDQGKECQFSVQGTMVRVDDDQVLRDLYACLDFLFGRPK